MGNANLHQLATIAVAVVSGDATRCQEILSRVHGMASTLPDAVLTEIGIELVPFGEGGKGVRGEFLPLDLNPEASDASEAQPDVGDLPWGKSGSESDDDV